MCTIYSLSFSLFLSSFLFPPFLLSRSLLTLSLPLSLSLPYISPHLTLSPSRSGLLVPLPRNAFSVPLPLPADRTFRFPSRAIRLFPRSFLVT
ncbi:hypothetical protein PUN28_002709 [Cardiocondyla obscurior]|uniref:Secreted protein n=1 Tax=Cardiocondyla obscurior TaxID=286306 RepID=A0AAW2GW11_9HYME